MNVSSVCCVTSGIGSRKSALLRLSMLCSRFTFGGCFIWSNQPFVTALCVYAKWRFSNPRDTMIKNQVTQKLPLLISTARVWPDDVQHIPAMSKRPSEETEDPETDSEDESRGFSQKYQLRGDYVKKFKSKPVGAASAETLAKKKETDAASEKDADADVDSHATLVKTKESMMAKSEEWLKWVQEHYKN